MRKILLVSALLGAALLAKAGDGPSQSGPNISGNFYFTNPDNALTPILRDGNGLGLRYGYSFNNLIEWDVGGVYTTHAFRNTPIYYYGTNGSLVTAQDPKMKYWAITSDLNFHFHPWDNSRSSVYLGAGIGYNNMKSDIPKFFGYGANATDKITGFLWEVDAGVNIALGDRLSLKIDGRQHFFNIPSNKAGSRSQFEYERFVGIGLGWFLGSTGPCTDSDGDGVCDSRDNCKNTPAGAKVDTKGCPTDEDGDGVPDGLDRCPGTPKGAKVDASGCELDDDADGVVNSKDKCPNTPRGAVVDANGCPIDSDGDGVWDGIDRCPNTPRGVKVDATGCPIDADDDGDGVPNSKDKCPNTPRGTKIDSSGCPAKVVEAVTLPLLTLTSAELNFTSGSSVIPHAAYKPLNEAATKIIAYIKNNPNAAHLDVDGHTDNKGSYALNSRLSRARANSVRAYLIRKGVPARSLEARGLGYSKPIASNDTPEGRRDNRRVEVIPDMGHADAESMASPEAGVAPAGAHPTHKKRHHKKAAAAAPKK